MIVYYVINDLGLALKPHWKTKEDTWVNPYQANGLISRFKAEDEAKRTGGRVVFSNSKEFNDLCQPSVQAQMTKWDIEKKTEEARAIHAEAHSWNGADTLREALGDWD